jgi:small subunit ribosomal protein S16
VKIMAVKLRLTRMGDHKNPLYRIVATDSRTKRDGEYIEKIGTYNPHTNPATVNIDEEVALKWLETGAIPSDTVRNLFKEAGIIKKFADSKKKK